MKQREDAKPISIVFMGCPDFAVASLSSFLEDDSFVVQAIYCMPDKPKGRGRKLAPNPVKEFALEHDFVIRTPLSFKNNHEEISFLEQLKPDYLVVVAYGLILPQAILDIPRRGAINLHASLLPLLRGASPIHTALIQGMSVTGNTVMLMNSKMDEGDMLSAESIKIEDSDNFETLHDRLKASGASLLLKTIKGYNSGEILPQPQDHTKASYTAKIDRQVAQINWEKSAREIINLIRAMSPVPGAWFECRGEIYKVFSAVEGEEVDRLPASILDVDPESGLLISCGENTSIKVLQIQKSGKNRQDISQFVRGCRFELGCIIK